LVGGNVGGLWEKPLAGKKLQKRERRGEAERWAPQKDEDPPTQVVGTAGCKNPFTPRENFESPCRASSFGFIRVPRPWQKKGLEGGNLRSIVQYPVGAPGGFHPMGGGAMGLGLCDPHRPGGEGRRFFIMVGDRASRFNRKPGGQYSGVIKRGHGPLLNFLTGGISVLSSALGPPAVLLSDPFYSERGGI